MPIVSVLHSRTVWTDNQCNITLTRPSLKTSTLIWTQTTKMGKINTCLVARTLFTTHKMVVSPRTSIIQDNPITWMGYRYLNKRIIKMKRESHMKTMNLWFERTLRLVKSTIYQSTSPILRLMISLPRSSREGNKRSSNILSALWTWQWLRWSKIEKLTH